MDSPALVRRTVSQWSMRSPARRRLRISFSSSCNAGGMIIEIGCPIASCSVYPNIRSAAAFHAEITPSSVLAMIASSEDSTMAA